MQKLLTPGQIAAVCYADVFDYPLTRKQTERYYVAGIRYQGKSKISVVNKNQYNFLEGREHIVRLRKKKEVWSGEKKKVAVKIAKMLRIIPTVRMVAVTGTLAMKNAGRQDDIDLLIVSGARTVWTTRLLTILLVELLGKRRRPRDKKASNKVCLNMFMDENHTAVPVPEQDIFSAHEVAQIEVLWGREEVIQQFWENNRWINEFLPNYKLQCSNKNNQINSILQSSNSKQNIFYFPHWYLKFILILNRGIWHFVEYILRQVQLFYMKTHRTNEVIKDGYLRFHPKDARKWILPEFEKRLELAGLR